MFRNLFSGFSVPAAVMVFTVVTVLLYMQNKNILGYGVLTGSVAPTGG